ncbi:phenylalanine--tRNA ligase subunit beta [Endozoicomonas sp. SCSIO W0465]|uniref:phenylalanine--tRNA ligase subunit beta n=1 Tax=Endozoicomonas sp. SCSIO W0465 TaxID=2918516 RepID=UPI002074C411|nr:phenylalanine--tRNA ligase subunit beta [Endozoicomonas sp. SCSIO W0465]USE34914.1 phenylalanine--tRNA ligase subunit beta [Endozoicomonas sp. SCSIO W0465]
MKFSEKWLRQWVNIEVDTRELVDKITMAGLEVDEVEAVAGEFTGVIIGKIIACEQHPDADKLRVTQVSTGSESFQVVCGAPNARVGIKVPFATVGAVLPGNFKIKKAKLRGVESFGMLCAEEELGMAESSDGLMELPLDAPVGQNIREYLSLDDKIIDVDLTPNRGDCLSIAGLAREVSANFLADVTEEQIVEVAPAIDDTFPVHIDAPQGCPRYVGRVIRNVDVSRSAPLWLTEHLRRSGIRSIDPVVDVTNYVMLELGQPMHGFDLDTLSGSIHVRMAKAEEQLTLLDGQEVTLNDNTLVIADEQKVLAIAGVMGGEGSGVSDKTRHIFLESAFFDPITIAGKARSYGLHTDSSHRFERGVDFQLQKKAVERATALIVEICGGEPGPVTEVASEAHLPALREVTLRSEKVTSLLGMAIDNSHIEALLSRLGLGLVTDGDGCWKVAVPSWRFDISIEEDLVEELGRIYGYNNLPESTPTALLKMKQVDESLIQESEIRRTLTARGYQEAVCFSFIAPELHQLFDPQHEPVALSNPIASDLSVMRTTLLPGLVKTAGYNLNRQQSRVRLFETGLTFIREKGKDGDELKQEPMLAALITGSRHPESWQGKAEAVDFFDLKGDFEALLALGQAGNEFVFRKGEHSAMHPGQCAEIVRAGKVVGHMGALHPSLARTMDMPTAVYLVELSLKALTEGNVTRFVALSKYPEVRRDLALVVNAAIAAGDIEQAITMEAGKLLRRVNTFDVYVGQGIEDGCKSLAMGLTLQHPSRTLKDDEVNELVDRVVARLKQDFNASLRQ